MLDKIRFMEMLQAITEIARTQQNYLTMEEIKNYFKDMKLEEKYYHHIYQYLGEHKITVEGFTYKPIPINGMDQEKEDKEEVVPQIENTIEDTKYLEVYLEDLSCFNVLQEKDTEKLVEQLKGGYKEAKVKLMEGYLYHVVTIAKEYKNRGMNMEDLIQEGNIGLMQAIERVETISHSEEGDAFLREMIEKSIEAAVDQEIEDFNWESTVIAKANLISEAAKYLEEDYKRAATVRELSDYTKLTEDEIQDILQLSLDVISIAKE